MSSENENSPNVPQDDRSQTASGAQRVPAETVPPQEPTEPEEPGRAFNWRYWNCIIIEMWERLAYYTLRPVAPIYIAQASDPGGLHLPQETKGWIYGWWAIFQSILPMFTGGYADRYGYKKTLFFSITLNIIGYLLMAFLHSYHGFFAGIIVLAIGTAFFKPSLQATLAHNLSKANASLGWGIFYWVVNFGSVIGHYISPVLLLNHDVEDWRRMFIACAIFTSMNYLLLFTYSDVSSGDTKRDGPLTVFWRTITNIFEPRLVTWLLIMSCFWLVMHQLWDLQPNFIEDWVDSSALAQSVPTNIWFFEHWQDYGDRGLMRVPQQVLISLNALLIVALMVPVSWSVRKLPTLTAMFFGMLIVTGGLIVAGLTSSGWILLFGIVLFSLGEMLVGPKKNEYLGLIAPPGKKGLYLGYVNIPVGVGVGIGSVIAGNVYGSYGEKATLALKELGQDSALVGRAAQCVDWSDMLERVPEITDMPRSEAFAVAQANLEAEPDAATEELRSAFRYDEGQLLNLGLIYLAQHEDHREAVAAGLAEELTNLADRLEAAQAAAAGGEPTQTVQELRARAAALADGAAPTVTELARYVHKLPDWTYAKRIEVPAAMRSAFHAERSGEPLGDDAIYAELWSRYSADPGVVNNFALEYVAQETYRVREAVAAMQFPDPPKDIPEKVGIGRIKGFAALSLARGVEADRLLETLAEQEYPETVTPTEQLYLYLIGLTHVREPAIGDVTWNRDVELLELLIADDAAALAAAREHAGAEASFADIANDTHAIKAALAKKNWVATPEHAARLLKLNPYEARAQAAAEVNKSAQVTTQMLWDKYDPQYWVWLPFAIVGGVASIALGIFGRMSKRWKDMQA